MLKVEKDYENEKNPNIRKVAEELISRAQNDELLKITFNKENKSLSEMSKYINQEAKKVAIKGMAMIEDQEVYGWAQHYYDEDSIVMNKPVESKPIEPKEKVDEIVLPEDELDDFDF